MAEDLQLLTGKWRRLRAQLPHLPRAVALIWAAARGWMLAWLFLLVVQGLLPVATVYLTRLLVDSLVQTLASGASWETARPTLVLIALLGGILLLAEALRSLAGWVRTAQAELVRDHISSLIHEKSVAADLAFYESPDFYDHLHRARAEASYRPIALMENIGSLIQNGITLLAMLVVLIPYSLWLPAALVASTLPAFVVVLRHTLRQHAWRMKATADERRTWYFDWLLTSGETAAELRLFHLGRHFRQAYQDLRARLRRERLDLARQQSLAELGAGALALLVSGTALAWTVWRALRGLLTLGDLALIYQAFYQGLRLMRSLLENAGQVYANTLFLGNLFEFLALEPQVVAPARPLPPPRALREGLRFRGITFRYPGSERPALSDFDLIIPAGQIAAIVGPNGAGKSTLIKLLCRLYDPEAGAIQWDDTDLRQFPLEELRRRITVLFQQPVHYSATVAENIALGDLRAAPGRPAIASAAQAAGAAETVARLPRSYETLLGKWFEGGTELSVGEWQRIALARAFLRRCPVLVLDEPTSAMDSWAEAEWLERFRSLVAGQTAIIITHRFTTAMHADVIHVLVEGAIVESGRHDELVARGGLYARSWACQMRVEQD